MDEVEDVDDMDELDVRGHATSAVTYAALVAGALTLGRLTGRSLPVRNSAADLVLGGVATHKLSRLLTKGSVASPLRAPFTEFEGASGAAEHHEAPRGQHGVRHTVGELVTCPYCLGVWLGTAYVGALAVAPRHARAIASVFSVVAVSDWLQLGYDLLHQRATA